MEYLGVIALLLFLCYSSYPGRLRNLERKVRKLKSKLEGGTAMSKLFSELTGKTCLLELDDDLSSTSAPDTDCPVTILDTDEEWVKIRFTDKKGTVKTQMLRLENILHVELLPETSAPTALL